jgi:hypothetical protein
MTTTATTEKRSIDAPDEVRSFDKGRIEFTAIGGTMFGRAVFEPGWRWSTSVKPLVGTESCELPHTSYVQSGALHVVMDDGTELDLAAGDIFHIDAGHDAWVVGDETCVMIDFGDEDEDYAKPAS